MPLVLGGSAAAAAAFEVDNSCRFDDGSGSYMHKTPPGAGSNSTFTFSCWLKRGILGTSMMLLDAGPSSQGQIYIDSQDQLRIDDGATVVAETNRMFRDVAAWYHIIVAYNEPGSGTDKVKIYVNGTLETSFATDNRSTAGPLNYINDAVQQNIGSNGSGPGSYYDGYMAEVVMTDGTQYAASDFGEFDEDSPTIWKPKDVSGLTFGTNGYHLDFKDSANLGNDANGGLDFTEVNLAAVDQCVDTPTNNFATFNSIDNYYQAITYSNGNMTMTTTGNISPGLSTIGLTAGKWYFEVKATDIHNIIGIQGTQITSAGQYLGNYANDWGYYGSNGNQYNNGSSTSYGDTYSTGDIIGVAVDLENNKLYFAKDNTWQNSGVPTSGATGTGAMSIGAASSTSPGYYLAGITSNTGSASANNGNFGNPPYANSSDAADENGYGKFEYAPPTGYLAICTKNLGSDGG